MIEVKEVKCSKWHVDLNTIKGYAYIILSALALSASQIVLRRAKWLTASDHALIRYMFSFVVFFVYIKCKKLQVFPKNARLFLSVKGLAGSMSLIVFYFAIYFTSPSNCTTLGHTSIIMTAVLSRIFFKEKLCASILVSVILSFVGVVFISKPTFLFKMESNSSTKANNLEFLGIGLALIVAILNSVVFLVLKKLCISNIHWSTNSISSSFFGVPICILTSSALYLLKFSHQNLNEELHDLPIDLLYSLFSSLCSLFGQIFMNKALEYEEPTKIQIAKTSDVLFSALLQYLLLNITLDLYNVVGALAILFGTVFMLAFRMADKKYQTHLIKKSKSSSQKIDDNANNNKESSRDLILEIVFFKI